MTRSKYSLKAQEIFSIRFQDLRRTFGTQEPLGVEMSTSEKADLRVQFPSPAPAEETHFV